jgi:hypothetical protein
MPLSIVASRTNGQWSEIRVAYSRESNAFVFLRQDGQRPDLSPAASTEAAAERLSEWLGMASFTDARSATVAALSVPAYAALLACADAHEAVGVRARRANQPACWPVLTSRLLEAGLKRVLTTGDGGRAILAVRRVCPAALRSATGRMEEGLDDLASAGFVRPIARGRGLTPAGDRVVTSLSRDVHAAGLSLAGGGSGRENAPGAAFFQSDNTLWLAEWSDLSGPDGTVKWLEATRADAFDVLSRLLDPAVITDEPSQETCTNPSCRAPIPKGKKFCVRCGQPVAARAVAPRRKCPNPSCGVTAVPSSKFCRACGTPLTSARP